MTDADTGDTHGTASTTAENGRIGYRAVILIMVVRVYFAGCGRKEKSQGFWHVASQKPVRVQNIIIKTLSSSSIRNVRKRQDKWSL